MKSREFKAALLALASLLESAGAKESSERILKFSVVFDCAPTSQVSALLKRWSAISYSDNSERPSLGDVERLVAGFHKLLSLVSKAGATKDLDAIAKFMREHQSVGLQNFVHIASEAAGPTKRPQKNASSGTRHDLVTYYQKALETTFGHEERFPALFNEISANADLGKNETIALAKQITGATVRSRASALKKIWGFNQSLVTFKSKSRATGGRSAA